MGLRGNKIMPWRGIYLGPVTGLGINTDLQSKG